MPLPDRWFMEHNPTEIVNMVGTITLNVLSQYTVDELVRIGFFIKDKNGSISMNPICAILFTVTSTGIWYARTDTIGQVIPDGLSADNAQYINRNVYAGLKPTFSAPLITQTSSTAAVAIHPRCHAVNIATGGAAIADQTLVPAGGADYYSCMRIIGIIADTADATVTLTFQDSDNAACEGAPFAFSVNIVANTVNTQLKDIVIKAPTKNRALEVDIADYAAANICFIFEFWYELA